MHSVHVGGLGGTYGGDPVACAAVIAAIDTMHTWHLTVAAEGIERTALPRLHAVASAATGVGDVRGQGAMLALEFAVPGTGEPDSARAGQVAKTCHENGIIVLTCGTTSSAFSRR